MNDVSVIRVSRCGITRGTLYGKHVLTLIWVIMTGGSFKIVSNWAVLTTGIRAILSRFHATYGQKCAYMSTSACGNTDANSMWTDTHGLLAVNPRAWHMGS